MTSQYHTENRGKTNSLTAGFKARKKMKKGINALYQKESDFETKSHVFVVFTVVISSGTPDTLQ